jgi:hypothetical protein
MARWLERFVIAALAAAVAFAVATATGQGGGTRGGFIDIPHGGIARFADTNITCVNPKAGGGVACDVDYVRWRNILHPVPMKFDVGLRLRCIDLGKWSRPPRDS